MPVQKGEKKVVAIYTGLGKPKLAADTKIVVDQPLEIEDEFRSLYEGSGKATNQVLEPKFSPVTLMQICFRNSILQQCIQVMEVNIDGTGFTIEAVDQGSEKKTKDVPPGKKPLFGKDPGGAEADGESKNLPPFARKALFGKPPNPDDPNDKRDPVKEALAAKLKSMPEKKDPEQVRAEDFFNEPYPGISFITLRRKLRVDMEQCGYGFLEGVRNIQGDLIMLRHLPAHTMRKLRLDAPVMVKRTLTRDGKEITVQLPMRERRYMQMAGNRQYFYKEFGCERDVHRETGEWLPSQVSAKITDTVTDTNVPDGGIGDAVGTGDGKKKKPPFAVAKADPAPILSLVPGADIPPTPDKVVAPALRGTEVIEFGIDRDPTSAYFLPRWINNLPSVLGSRKAQEYNLEFFDSGGIPPILILLEGGTLTTTVRQQLQQQMSGKDAKNRAAIVEIQSASGTLEKPGTVGVKVERFGDSRQGDSMFQQYDENCEEDVRMAFRLPPLFLGQASDYNFATAVVAYMVAEEQVFGPERKEFDEIINKTVMKALDIKKFKFVSKPITLKNAEVMMEAITLGKEYITPEEFIDKLNEIAGMNMEYDEAAAQHAIDTKDPAKVADAEAAAQAKHNPPVPPMGAAGGRPPGAQPGPYGRPATGITTPTKVVAIRKSLKTAAELVDMAQEWCRATGMTGAVPDPYTMADLSSALDNLTPDDRGVFDRLVAMKTISRDSDPEGMAELAGCCIDMRETT